MKKRMGFVSNSSSSSFMICIDDLNAFQLIQILDQKEKTKWGSAKDWDIIIKDRKLIGSTDMDNFSYMDVLKRIGVDMSKVMWDDYNSWEDE